MDNRREFERARFKTELEHARLKNRMHFERLAHEVVMWQAVQIMNAPLQETARLITQQQFQARTHYQPPASEAIKGCIGWLMVMAVATGTGFALGYISKYWF